jgi:hypothetical protein
LAGAANLLLEVKGNISRLLQVVREDREIYERVKDQLEHVRSAEGLPPEEQAAADEYFRDQRKLALKEARAFVRMIERDTKADHAA